MAISKPTLLIVEDETCIRDPLALMFSELGFCVRSASNGFSALGLICESAPNILILDLNMPGLLGFELLSLVRQIYPAIYVIATSGAFRGTVMPHGVHADAFYEKTAGLTDLLDLMGSVAHSEWAVRRLSSGTEPMWMTSTGQLSSEVSTVLLGSPQCLEAFLKVPVEKSQLALEAGCLRCHDTITCAVVTPNELVLGLPSLSRALVG